jgi:hypothetical protein
MPQNIGHVTLMWIGEVGTKKKKTNSSNRILLARSEITVNFFKPLINSFFNNYRKPNMFFKNTKQ